MFKPLFPREKLIYEKKSQQGRVPASDNSGDDRFFKYRLGRFQIEFQ
jgi:hypothetical protein